MPKYVPAMVIKKCNDCPHLMDWDVCVKLQREIDDNRYEIPPDCPLKDVEETSEF